MTLELYTTLRNDIEPRLNKVDAKAKAFTPNSNGLVERTESFLKAKKEFDIVFNQLRTLNSSASNKIKREYSLNKRK